MSGLNVQTDAGRAALEAVTERPSGTLLAVDFDGTLAPIVPDPEAAEPHPAAVSALGRLGRLVGTVAVITGRPAQTAVRLGGFAGHPGLTSLVVLGQYGVERWDAGTGELVVPPEPEAVTAAAEELPGVLASLGLEGARIEHKGRALGVHTRRLPQATAAYRRLQEPLGRLAERHGLVVEPGKQVLEIRAPGMDKGDALRRLVAERSASSVIFAGDDLGDLPAFAAVAALRGQGLPGLLICSASHEEDALARLADVVVDGPAGVAAWLEELGDRLEGTRSAG